MESPDSGQPELPHAGSCNATPLMSWPSAMKVSAAVGPVVTLAGADAVPGDGAVAVVAGATGVAGVTPVVTVLGADDAAGLADELHAVTSKAAQASAAQVAADRARCEFMVHMDVQPLS